MVHLQQVCNAAARALLRNLGIASGPQVDVDSERLAPGEDLEAIYPLKIWQTRNPHNSSSRAINFFQPDSNVTELMGVYDRFAQLADDYTGIPAYAFGSDKVAGAGRTSSGLSMLMSNSAKGIKRVILDIDMKVMRTLVQRMFDWNMQFSEDPDIKGDMAIVTTGTVALMAKEQMSSRRMEFLNVTNNDLDIPLIGKQNRANLLREVGSTLEIEGKNIVKTPEEIRDLVRDQESQEAQEAERMAQLEQERGQAELANITAQAQLRQAQAQREAAELQIEQQRLQIETTNAETARFKAEADAKAKLVMAEANQLKVSSEVAGQAFEKLSEVQNVNQT
jgi:hypothetical protein